MDKNKKPSWIKRILVTLVVILVIALVVICTKFFMDCHDEEGYTLNDNKDETTNKDYVDAFLESTL